MDVTQKDGKLFFEIMHFERKNIMWAKDPDKSQEQGYSSCISYIPYVYNTYVHHTAYI